jgi:hypothetical protein
MDTSLGRYRAICSATSLTFDPAARATTSKLPGSESTTFRHWRPMDPVEPKMAMRFMRLFCTCVAREEEGGF